MTVTKLTSGFNKSLVIKQLKRVIPAGQTQTLNDNMERVKYVWERSGPTNETRDKFILVDWFGDPFHVLVSEYSEHIMRNTRISMDIFLIKHHGMTTLGIPIPDKVVKDLGGEAEISRMIAIGGLEMVLSEFEKINDSDLINEGLVRLREYIAIERKGLGL